MFRIIHKETKVQWGTQLKSNAIAFVLTTVVKTAGDWRREFGVFTTIISFVKENI